MIGRLDIRLAAVQIECNSIICGGAVSKTVSQFARGLDTTARDHARLLLVNILGLSYVHVRSAQ